MSDQELNNKTPELLYHYCSVETFFQIITNQTLRLTNIQYMNDAEELHYGLDMLGEAEDKYKLIDKRSRDYVNIYAMCFSEEGDLLSQWRGYGDNAEGVSIGFDFSMLRKENQLHIPRDKKTNAHYIHSLQQVIYNPEEQEKKISEFLNIDKTHNFLEVKLWGRLIASLKNSYFDEEKEWRLISSINRSLVTNDKDENISFCVTNKNIVPYIDRKFKDLFNISKWKNKPQSSSREEWIDFENQLSLIKHIIIGSSCKLDKITIEKFLFQHDMPFIEKYIKIEKSKLSYRAK